MLCLEQLQPPLAHADPIIPMGYAADAPTATPVSAWQWPLGCRAVGHISLNILCWDMHVPISELSAPSKGAPSRCASQAIPLHCSSVERIYSSFPRAPLALLWLCLFSAPAGIQRLSFALTKVFPS